jgi:hypothetical protein
MKAFLSKLQPFRHYLLAAAACSAILFGQSFMTEKNAPRWMFWSGFACSTLGVFGIFTLASRIEQLEHDAERWRPMERDQSAFLVGYRTSLLNLEYELRKPDRSLFDVFEIIQEQRAKLAPSSKVIQ